MGFIEKVNEYIIKFKRAKKLYNIKRIEFEADNRFNIVKVHNKPVIMFDGVIITTSEETEYKWLVKKMFALREMYVKNRTNND